MSTECYECMNAVAVEECPVCGQEFCEFCLEDHECEEDYLGED